MLFILAAYILSYFYLTSRQVVTFKSDLSLLLFKSQIYDIVMVKQMDLGSFLVVVVQAC